MFTAHRWLLLALSAGTILLGDSPQLRAQDLREVATLSDDSKPLRTTRFAFFTPDGKSLVMGDDFGAVSLWDRETKKSKGRWVNPTLGDRFHHVMNAAISPDGKWLVTTVNPLAGKDASGAILFELATGKRLHRFGPGEKGGGDVWIAAFSPDGKTLVTGNESGYLILWDVVCRL